MPHELSFWLLALTAAFFVGASKGGLPMIGMLAVPLLGQRLSIVAAAGLLLPVYVASDLYGLWIYRRSYSKRNLAILIPAGAFGVFIGWLTAHLVSDRTVGGLVGVIGLLYCLKDLIASTRPEAAAKPADLPRGLLWGSLSGFTSFVSHAGAPPYQIYVLPQRLEKMAYAGTTTIIFAAINFFKLPPYWQLGQLTLSSLKQAVLLMPMSLLGAYAGYQLTKILPERLFFTIVKLALFLLSLKLIYDSFS